MNRLPVTIHPTEGQGLDCYLEHLADANGMTTAALLKLLTPSTGSAGRRFLMINPQPELTARLTELSGIEGERLRVATLAANPGIDVTGFDPTQPATFRTISARGWFPGHGTACCPECLASDGTWRLSWRLPTTTICVRHQVILLSECPTCARVFRDQRHSPLRSIGARTICGNPLGRGPREHCRQDLGELDAVAANTECVERQRQHDQALHVGKIRLCAETVTAAEYLQSVTAAAALLLHLAPHRALPPRWAAGLDVVGPRRRWAIKPPVSLVTRSHVLTEAHQLLTATDLDTAAEQFQPWLDVVPDTSESVLGWIADHTRMTAALTRIVMNGDGRRFRVPAHLARMSRLTPSHRVPQAISPDLAYRHLHGMFDSRDHVVSTFASLCLVKAGHPERTWTDAGRLLGLPDDLARATARTAIRHLTSSPAELAECLARLAQDLPSVNCRERESRIRTLAIDDTWFSRWRRRRPRTRPPARRLAIAWLWSHYASAHLACAPIEHRPRLREHLRNFDIGLDAGAKEALLVLAEQAKP
ncbi:MULTISPECIES: TniQ family protein [Aeromicrobium]|uniref:TniQ family protein n=1 Tax=Aeromicrobium TaxID=2040 RepID=UPI00257FFF86|nr:MULTISPECIES: TniQ family protein [Aeromicrobium]